MKGDNLGELEELVLLAVRRLGDDATGTTIQTLLRDTGDRDTALGALYAVLDRAQRKGLVSSRLGQPSPVPGGRRRRHYALTPAGDAAVRAARQVREALWRTSKAGAR